MISGRDLMRRWIRSPALPRDVRKASSFPKSYLRLIEAPPPARGVASLGIKEILLGKAKPFRTSGGKATAALVYRRRRLMLRVIKWRLNHRGGNAMADCFDGNFDLDLRTGLRELVLHGCQRDHLLQ